MLLGPAGHPLTAEYYVGARNYKTLAHEYKEDLLPNGTAYVLISLFKHKVDGSYLLFYYACDENSKTETSNDLNLNAGPFDNYIIPHMVRWLKDILNNNGCL